MFTAPVTRAVSVTVVATLKGNVEKAKAVLGWEAQIGVREGIAQTTDWLRERLAAVAGQ